MNRPLPSLQRARSRWETPRVSSSAPHYPRSSGSCCWTSALAQKVIVWDFATREGEKTPLTASLTQEFEEALSQKPTFSVLERRKLDQLTAVINNEKALQDIGEISPGGATQPVRCSRLVAK